MFHCILDDKLGKRALSVYWINTVHVVHKRLRADKQWDTAQVAQAHYESREQHYPP